MRRSFLIASPSNSIVFLTNPCMFHSPKRPIYNLILYGLSRSELKKRKPEENGSLFQADNPIMRFMGEGQVSSQNKASVEFKEYMREKRRRSLLGIFVLGFTASPAFFFLDYYVIGGHFWLLVTIRALVTAVFILFMVIYKKRVSKLMWLVDIFGALPIFIVSILIAIVVYYSGGSESPYRVGFLMMTLISGIYVYCSKIEGFILTIGIASLYTIHALLAPGPLNLKEFITYSAVLYALSIMIYHALRSRHNLEEETFTANRQIEEQNVQLQQLDKAKNRFFSNITHEFRTPLVAFSASLQMIRAKMPDDQDLKPLLDSSQQSLEDMLDNVNDLLTKTRSEKGMLDMRWSEINMVEFVSRSLKVFEPFAAKQKNKLIFTDLLPANGSPETPRLYVDREKLKKILNNLVGNAMKFTKDGEIEIILDRTDTHCILKVRDTGPGIPKEDLGIIFDSFTQASNNVLREVQGTGLGLAMVKDFTLRHDGSISVDSELGKGSVFTVALPWGDAHVDRSKMDTTEIIEEEGVSRINLGLKSFTELDLSPFSHHDPKRHNVLLVEDNPQVIQALAYVLKDHYNLYFAQDGQEGLAQAREINPHLVISDVMMPKMTGYEMVHAIKNDHDLK